MTNTTFPKPPLQSNRKPSSSKRRLLMSAIALVLSAVAILFTALTWQEINVTRVRLNKDNDTIKTQLLQAQAQIKNEVSANKKQIDQLLATIGNTTAQQTIAEAAYLVRLAHLHLKLEDNLTLTIQLLKMAQSRLTNVDTPFANKIKRAIKDDITTLSDIPTIDIPALSKRIDAISKAIAALPEIPQNHIETTTTADVNTQPSDWWERIKNNLSGLKHLFIIRRIDAPVQPLLKPQQTLFLRENMQLKLAQAQWALMHQYPDVYQQSLGAVHQWLTQYDHSQPDATELAKRISELALINIKPSLPRLLSVQIIKDGPDNTPVKPAAPPSSPPKSIAS